MSRSPEQELAAELVLLRIAAVRRLRERLEDPNEPATPSYLDVARKMISDLMGPTPPPPKAPAIVRDLPFTDPDGA